MTRKLAVLFALVSALCLAMPALAGGQFPNSAEYSINCTPAFQVSLGSEREVVTTHARVVIRASDPYLTPEGTRRVDLKIVSWQAEGTSKLLGGPLKFRMLNAAAPAGPSFVETYRTVSVKSGAPDFPARAQFVVPYEVDTPFGTVGNLSVVVRGAIRSFPPAPEDLFKMEQGDVAKIMAQLLPAQLSSLSAAGDVAPVSLSLSPIGCHGARSVSIRQVRF